MGNIQGAAAADTQKANQNSKAQLEQDAENKEQASALKEFQQVLQKAGQI